MTVEAMNFRSLISIFRSVSEMLRRERQERFPPGRPVTVCQPGRYTGPGVTRDSTDLPADEVAVQIENGNVWHYGIEFVKQA